MTIIAAFITAIVILSSIYLGGSVAHSYNHPSQWVSDPFSQINFPCQEDERLGFAPQFGSSRVGCIHIAEGE